MAAKCYFTGKQARVGNQIARRGKAKFLGGVGVKTTGISKRKSSPTCRKCERSSMGKSFV